MDRWMYFDCLGHLVVLVRHPSKLHMGKQMNYSAVEVLSTNLEQPWLHQTEGRRRRASLHHPTKERREAKLEALEEQSPAWIYGSSLEV